ncbi:MAG: hypothetical protein H6Q15_2604 [Bacteroidetes bacterium]|nr:hypothetical protein [Bacteroidota bacterium]
MIIFDNIYYFAFSLLKGKLMTYGPKFTAVTITSFYCIAFIIFVFNLSSLFFYDNSKVFIILCSSITEKTIMLIGGLSGVIRFYGFKSIQDIENTKNKMNLERRKRLDTITIFTMVLLPILTALSFNLKSSFIGVYP